ncbi:Cytochrome P450 monooxygenase 151 [Psilocybe cubensis]|uniref:Cytochrome P450 n=2 Tax=Psilocybe cubensis TaxID=181762 RepID=A0A8H7XTJ7_PSICU|nr:Cytochrome P450 monooxygenase 151 [Psilocybe cubensis]KAH9474336.1 Cytochrome P450 monooxygenase 151 [Psilocybe cubensis]
MFKISTLDGWLVVVNGTQQIDDIRRANDEQMHGMTTVAEYLQLEHTLGPELLDDPYHIDVIRMSVTRNIAARFEDIHDEVRRAYSDAIKVNENDWTALPAYELQVQVINRVSARYFFGKPLCDDREFLEICDKATIEIFKGRFLRVLPVFLRPKPNTRLGARAFTNIHGLRGKVAKYLAPIIEERLEQERLYGAEWPDKPNDLITWLMDGARASNTEISAEDMSIRVLFISFGAIHTSTATITAALYQLCLSPGSVKELREEIENVVASEGWSKASLGKMYKLDSYLRESQRHHFMNLFAMSRVTLKDFVFSDGTVLPKGTNTTVNIVARHHDESIYPNSNIFDGFRFVRDPKEGITRPMLATPTLEYHAFGHGRSACPGRFFAVTELKTMVAHIVTNYDIKLEKDDGYPKKLFFEQQSFPNMHAKILFRKRNT